MNVNRFDRRRFLAASAAAAGTAVVAPYVRTARAAGSLTVGFWDHWVPGANAVLTKLCKEWAAREKVDLKIDYITSQGNKLELTFAAEAQARSGHDILQPIAWTPAAYARDLEPMDDLMATAIKQNGTPTAVAEYLGHKDGHWLGVPAVTGSQVKPPCARIDRFKEYAGLDVTKMYAPPGQQSDQAMQDNWTWDTFLHVAEMCHKGGHPFGLGLGQTTDSVDWVGALFNAFGATLVDEKGNVVVNSDNTKRALEWSQRLVKVLPSDVFAWDDASNNKYLISGQGSLIMNPPSAWAVAKRDAPQVAKECWTFPAPKGPLGKRYTPGLPFFWTVWKWSPNKSAAKSLLAHLISRESTERLVTASGGYDIPQFSGLRGFKIWAEEGPPKGTVYHYPPTNDQIVSIAGAPAPVHIANLIYTQAILTKMIAKCTSEGQSIPATIGWASKQLEAFAMM